MKQYNLMMINKEEYDFRYEYMQNLAKMVRTCNRCRLHSQPCVLWEGSFAKGTKVVFVGEAPGRTEVEEGRPFIGKSGQILREMIQELSLTRDGYYITNAVKCRPPGNKTPSKIFINSCKYYLHRELSFIRPRAIATLGSSSLYSVTGSIEGLSAIDNNELNFHDIPVIHFPHPAYVLRKGKIARDLFNKSKERLRDMIAC